jgi:hypothetical protein
MVDYLHIMYAKEPMDAGPAHSKAYEEIMSTTLDLIYEKGLIKEFIMRFERSR